MGRGPLRRAGHRGAAADHRSIDVDAAIVTLGGLRDGDLAVLAAMAIAGTIIVNMAVKIGITLVYARGKGLFGGVAMAASVVALIVDSAWPRCGCRVSAAAGGS